MSAPRAAALAKRVKVVKAAPAKPKARRVKRVQTTGLAVKSLIAKLSEAQFQRQVKAVLSTLGYVVWTFPIMKRTTAGVPDLTVWHPNKPGRLWFWELKTEKGRVRPEQVISIAHLSTVPGVDARIVRPADWPALREGLIR